MVTMVPIDANAIIDTNNFGLMVYNIIAKHNKLINDTEKVKNIDKLCPVKLPISSAMR